MNILDTRIIYCLTHEVVLIHQIQLDLSINFFAGVYYLCVFNWNVVLDRYMAFRESSFITRLLS